MQSVQDLSDEILTELEKTKAITFAEDKVQFEAVKKYILAVAYKHGVPEAGKPHLGNINFALNLAWPATQPHGIPRSDEEIGQNLRALTYAIQLVESGFREIAELKKPEPEVEEEKVNPSE